MAITSKPSNDYAKICLVNALSVEAIADTYIDQKMASDNKIIELQSEIETL